MKILVYHGKHGDEYYDISTDHLRGNAYRKLFDVLGGAGYYDGPDPDSEELELFDKAAAGDEEAVVKFMQVRSDLQYEYERLEEIEPEQVLTVGQPIEPLETDFPDDYDPEHEHQKDLKAHVREIPMDAEGYTLIDPRTGIKYMECDSCGMVCELEDYHSGGECNICHAVNKDD